MRVKMIILMTPHEDYTRGRKRVRNRMKITIRTRKRTRENGQQLVVSSFIDIVVFSSVHFFTRARESS